MRVSLRVTKDSSPQVGGRPIRRQAILLKRDPSPAEELALTPTLSSGRGSRSPFSRLKCSLSPHPLLREREPESPLPAEVLPLTATLSLMECEPESPLRLEVLALT